MDHEAVRTGFMTVLFVSGSVVVLAHQFHKRLLSNFMTKMESELGSGKSQRKKKVRFSDEELKILSTEKQGLRKSLSHVATTHSEHCDENKKCRKTMPRNWQVMYKEIINYRNSIYIQ